MSCRNRRRIDRTARALLALTIISLLLVSGCVPLPAPGSAPSGVAASPPLPTEKLIIYAPATPSSIPIILAARQMGNAEVTIFNNHMQANAQFLRGDVDILVTGLAVGVDMFKNGAPVQVIDSYVAGLTYLVTYGKKVESFADLKGQEVYIPFEGSPIEEVTQFFVEQEGLVWKTDIKPIYSPFTSSVELLKQGRATAVALPEPSVSLIENQPNLYISLDYRTLWDEATGSSTGYPQVTPFVRQDWAAAHPDIIARFNDAVAAAVTVIQQDPATAVAESQAALGLPASVLQAALQRTDFAFSSGDALVESITGYYRTIGRPLETFDAFFYRSPQ